MRAGGWGWLVIKGFRRSPAAKILPPPPVCSQVTTLEPKYTLLANEDTHALGLFCWYIANLMIHFTKKRPLKSKFYHIYFRLIKMRQKPSILGIWRYHYVYIYRKKDEFSADLLRSPVLDDPPSVSVRTYASAWASDTIWHSQRSSTAQRHRKWGPQEFDDAWNRTQDQFTMHVV
jgi:hypothetical protein